MYRTGFWTLWEKARMDCFERTASKHVYYLGWNRSPAQAGCMRQVLRTDALGRPRGIGWRGRWEGGSGWGIHVYPWLIHVYVWQNPLQYCKVISLQLIKINVKKLKNLKKRKETWRRRTWRTSRGSWRAQWATWRVNSWNEGLGGPTVRSAGLEHPSPMNPQNWLTRHNPTSRRKHWK